MQNFEPIVCLLIFALIVLVSLATMYLSRIYYAMQASKPDPMASYKKSEEELDLANHRRNVIINLRNISQELQKLRRNGEACDNPINTSTLL